MEQQSLRIGANLHSGLDESEEDFSHVARAELAGQPLPLLICNYWGANTSSL